MCKAVGCGQRPDRPVRTCFQSAVGLLRAPQPLSSVPLAPASAVTAVATVCAAAFLLVASTLESAAAEPVEPADARLRDLTPRWETGPGPILKGFHNLYNACVVKIPDREYPYRLFFFGYAAEDHNPGYPGGDAIYLGRAHALDDWEVYSGDQGWDRTEDPAKYVPVVYGDPKPYDGMANGDPSVVYRDGVYHMALSSVGFDSRADATGTQRLYVVNCVLGATSTDGRPP